MRELESKAWRQLYKEKTNLTILMQDDNLLTESMRELLQFLLSILVLLFMPSVCIAPDSCSPFPLNLTLSSFHSVNFPPTVFCFRSHSHSTSSPTDVAVAVMSLCFTYQATPINYQVGQVINLGYGDTESWWRATFNCSTSLQINEPFSQSSQKAVCCLVSQTVIQV